MRSVILILVSRDLDAGGGAAYRILNLAKYISNRYDVIIIDANINNYIRACNMQLIRINLNRSIILRLLSYLPSIIDKTLITIFRFSREEVGRLTRFFDMSIFINALSICIKARPFIIMIEENSSLIGIAYILSKFFKSHIILDLHNVESYRLMRMPNYKRLFNKLIYLTEYYATKLSRVVFVVSKHEYIIASKLLKPHFVRIIPNFVCLNEIFQAKYIKFDLNLPKKYIIFHGDFRYFPNREALSVMIREIMPKIWKDHPDIFLLISGPGLQKFYFERIISLGFLSQAELYKVISKATCAIVPLLRGGGTRIKILEYMANGIPVISTKIGAEGLEVEHLKHIILVKNIGEIPYYFDILIKDPKIYSKLSYNAMTLIQNKYDIFKVADEVIKIFESLMIGEFKK